MHLSASYIISASSNQMYNGDSLQNFLKKTTEGYSYKGIHRAMLFNL